MTLTERPTRRKASWDEVAARVRTQFPNIDKIDWRRTFDERPEVFAAILRDMLKVDAKEPGTPGPRPEIEPAKGRKILSQWMGNDYALSPFPQAFGDLVMWRPERNGKRKGKIGLTTIAKMVGIERSKVGRMLSGEIEPSAWEMEQIAKAFGKDPSYFVEWRTAFVVATLAKRMNDSPETTIGFYRRLVYDL